MRQRKKTWKIRNSPEKLKLWRGSLAAAFSHAERDTTNPKPNGRRREREARFILKISLYDSFWSLELYEDSDRNFLFGQRIYRSDIPTEKWLRLINLQRKIYLTIEMRVLHNLIYLQHICSQMSPYDKIHVMPVYLCTLFFFFALTELILGDVRFSNII